MNFQLSAINVHFPSYLRLVMEPEWEAKIRLMAFDDPVCETNVKRAYNFYLQSRLTPHAVLKAVRVNNIK